MVRGTLDNSLIPRGARGFLTPDYIARHGWYPVPGSTFDRAASFERYEETHLGRVPWGTIDNFRVGDIIIYKEGGEMDELTFDELREYRENDTLPIAVVVPRPERLGN